MYRVLLADDDKATVSCLQQVLKEWGYDIAPTFNGQEAGRVFLAGSFDLVIADIRMEPVGGVELLRMIRQHDADIPVIIISGYEDIGAAAESMQAGAFDYVEKPFDIHELAATMSRALAYRQALRGVLDLKLVVGAYRRCGDLVTQSESMQHVSSTIQEVAATDVSVLISGEEGTGQALVARTIHGFSLRREKPFIALDCAQAGAEGTPGEWRSVLDSTEGGTLFLRNVHRLPSGEQVAFLDEIGRRRNAEARPVQESVPRLLASMEPGSAGLGAALAAELNGTPIKIEPLRARWADLLPLVYHLLRREAGGAGDTPPVEIDVCLILERYDWPGNVAELAAMIHDIMAHGKPDVIRQDLLPIAIREKVGDVSSAQRPDLRKEFLLGRGLERFISERGRQKVTELVDSFRSSSAETPTAESWAARRRKHGAGGAKK